MLDHTQPPDAATALSRPSPGDPGDLGQVRAVIDALPEPVFVVDREGRLQLTNGAADDLFAGRPVQDRTDLLSRFEDVTPDRRPRRTVASPAAGQRPLTVRPRHQPNRWYAMRTVALGEGLQRGGSRPAADPQEASTEAPDGPTMIVLRDVTDTRELEQEREAFLAVLSHELRTPITTIYAGATVLARHEALSPPVSQTLAMDISAEAARLYDLVEDLLALARLERRVLEPIDEPVFLQRAVDSTVRMAVKRYPEAPIVRIGVADPPPVHGDATYVEQACRNLIITSQRYAGPGQGRALIVDVGVDPDEGVVTVTARDRGPTMTEDELDRAFELPEVSAVGRLSGAGIAPFVTRHLVEAMGGRTWACNRTDGPGVELGFALKIHDRS
jgi:signal transduction histidine kinase